MSALRAERRVIAALVVLASLLGARPAAAVEPFVNLGFTSFVDGFPDPTGEGFAVVQYLRYARANALKDARGNDAAGFIDPSLDAVASVTQLLYTFRKPEGFPLHPAISLLVPVVYLNASFDPGGAVLRDNGLGVGDIFLGPVLQFPTIMSGERPLLFHRVEFDVIVPVGKYDRNRQLNQGYNQWGLNPFWSATLLPIPLLEVSWRLHWLYNFENPEPVFPPPGAPPVNTTQAGQAVHANLASSIEVIPNTLRVGVSSYYFRQLTASQENGAAVSGREQVLGIGPGLVWFPSKVDLVFLNAYYETAVRNRFQSHSIQVRWGHAF